MPRPQSTIWQYFSIVPGPDNKSRKAACSFCGHQQACGITRLHQHLLNKCTQIPSSLQNELRLKEECREEVRGKLALQAAAAAVAAQNKQREEQQPACFQRTMGINYALSTLATQGMSHLSSTTLGFDSGAAAAAAATTTTTAAAAAGTIAAVHSPLSPTPNHQPPSTNPSPPLPPHTSSSSSLDWYLARALFSAGIPFTVVDNPHFATFLKHMRPGYIVPRPFQLRQYILKEQHWDLIEMPASIVEPDTHPAATPIATSASTLSASDNTSTMLVSPASSSSSSSSSSAAAPSSIRNPTIVKFNRLANSMSSSNDDSASASISASQTPSARLPMRVPPELDASL